MLWLFCTVSPLLARPYSMLSLRNSSSLGRPTLSFPPSQMHSSSLSTQKPFISFNSPKATCYLAFRFELSRSLEDLENAIKYYCRHHLALPSKAMVEINPSEVLDSPTRFLAHYKDPA